MLRSSKIGRPKIDPKLAHKKAIRIRLTDEENDTLEYLASMRNMSKSEYIRFLINMDFELNAKMT